MSPSRRPPPYRIETERLVVRCWEPADAPALKEAIDSSLDHLQPWMPGMLGEPEPLPAKVERLRGHRAAFDRDEDFAYGIFSLDESEVVGGTGLHTWVPGEAFEIAYWLRASRAGRGLATEAVSALIRVAFDLCGVDRIDIRVDPANERSASIPRRLGFVEEATLRRRLPPKEPGGDLRDVTMFSLLASEYAASELGGFTLRAYDAAGGRLI